MAEAGAHRAILRKTGWLKLYRSETRLRGAGSGIRPGRASSACRCNRSTPQALQALEPSLNPVFAHAVFWPQAASVSNPLGVTRAYAARFAALGGVTLSGDARSLHRAGNRWRVETDEGGARRAGGRGRARPLGARSAGAAWA